MTSKEDIVFPLTEWPSDVHVGKILGLYPQRQEGWWMQRVKVPGGVLSGGQWKALAAIARELTPGAPLHLTTRQDVELHELTVEAVLKAQAMLAQAELTTVGGGGDTLRNITVCPCSGLRGSAPDLTPLARAIDGLLKEYENIYSLPRKFKISLSACPSACAQPWINDLGLVARQGPEGWGFEVIGAGSLGARPCAGISLYEFVPARDVLPLALAAIRVFDAHGDREHRGQARLRHVRQRLGDEPFRALLDEEFAKARAQQSWPAMELTGPVRAYDSRLTLTFANGDVWPQAAQALGELADREDVRVRIANFQQVILFGRDEQTLAGAVSGSAPLAAAAVAAPTVIACPGTRWCKRGLVGTNAMAARIRQLANLGDKVVAISGCPNGCVHSAVADIGLSGVVVTRDSVRQEGFAMTVGGGMGRSAKLGQPAGTLTADEVIAKLQE